MDAGLVLSEPTDGFGIGVELSFAFHEMDGMMVNR